ncbi:hypothetical protein [Deinococcus sp. 12RED42]|uniref:hypothetical protein n=1 Tax=Deinococcus sp. 12RED42 TaxID=2745872 RepID=UPI001E54B869|nr:hypothetical protein [Deinococcus sp. 12RED42]
MGGSLQTLHHELGLPVRRIGRVMDLLGSIQITQRAIIQASRRLAADDSALAAHFDALLKECGGARTYMRIKSTVVTARLRGQDPVAVLTGLMV